MNRFIKTGISIAAAVAITASASAMALAADYMGDVNDDGKVNSADALAILRYTVGIDGTEINLKKADVNSDGSINSSDALKVLRMSVSLEDLIEIKEENN